MSSIAFMSGYSDIKAIKLKFCAVILNSSQNNKFQMQKYCTYSVPGASCKMKKVGQQCEGSGGFF